ncbi:HAD hydrolase-like protein [Terrabacter aerolatus]|uniref:Haloacid dehalogenase n=1 Tax=Terrabacter aerolatus TaxID=422442 RepID=A0A512D4T8_9MICO|nr:HAD-IIA family hydrolase [Terrabacter aerolatus]GEO31481.1 haloacid dehalogenase [Terrabacter aerolatus]
MKTEDPVIAGYDGVVCDLDGVVYRGAEAVPEAADALQRVVQRGVKVVYATNNASRVPAEVAEQVAGLGAPATAADVVSSAQAGAARLAEQLEPGATVLALGGDGVIEALQAVGLAPVSPGADAGELETVAAVLQGYGRQLSVRDFETAARLLTTGLPWVASNDDATLPLPWGQSPGNGAYVDLLAAAVGRRPDVVGKPHPPLYRLSLDRLGTEAARTLAVGDRLDTDIAGAEAAGVDAAWVLTGVDGPTELVLGHATPTYVLASLADLLRPYAVPTRDAGGWRCGSARVTSGADGLRIERGGADAIEVVRAGVAALLEMRDAAGERDGGGASGGDGDRLRAGAAALEHVLDDAAHGERD